MAFSSDSTVTDCPEFSLDFPRAFGLPPMSADFRTQPEDFQVDEQLGFQPCGQGEHVYLHLKKVQQNTAWVANQIARLAQVKSMDVGYCGLKDRHAVTTQWFSVYLPTQSEPDWTLLETLVGEREQGGSDTPDPGLIKLLNISRHTSKLRRGTHQSNNFVIRLKNIQGSRDAIESRLAIITEKGVPNYFGEQRFGHDGNNLKDAQAVFLQQSKKQSNKQLSPQRRGRKQKNSRDKQKQGLITSAARSYLFNRVLAVRVEQACWNVPIDPVSPSDPTSKQSFNLSLTGPLWGRGRPAVTGKQAILERDALLPYGLWCNALEHAGLSQDRRDLILKPGQLQWQWEGSDLQLSFSLLPGAFATTVLRELADLTSKAPVF